jgi:protein-disulfide isomerase
LNQGKQLREEYEASGKVRFDYKDFIVISPESATAANAAKCAADQSRFWDYHDLLMSRSGLSADAFSKASLKSYAQQLGLDAAKFNACVDSDQHLDEVYQNVNEGKQLGVQSTPTFFINGQKVEGAVPYEQLKSIIDGYLANAQ